MSNKISDGSPLPTTKTDLVGLPSGADPTKYWAATDANQLPTWFGDIRAWFNGQVANYMRFGANGSDSVSVSNEARVSADASGSLRKSENGRLFRPLSYDYDVREFGTITFDSSTSGNALQNINTLQAAETFAEAQLASNLPVRIVVPSGGRIYIKDNPSHSGYGLYIRGNSAHSQHWVGAVGLGDEFDQGVQIWWAGSAGATVVYFESFNKGMWQDIAVFGNSIAGICLWFAGHILGTTTEAATSGFSVHRVRVGGVKLGGAGAYGAVLVGTPPGLVMGNTYEVADGHFTKIDIFGEDPGAPGFTFSGMQAYGWQNCAGGNAKCFRIQDVNVLWCNIGIDNPAGSAQLIVDNVEMGDVRQAYRHASGELLVNGGDHECGDVDDFKILTGTAQAGSYASIVGCEFAAFMAGSDAEPVAYGGYLHFTGNYVRNGNTGIRADGNYFHFKVAGDNFGGPDTQGGFRSKANWYYGQGGNSNNFIPIINGSSDPLWPVVDTYGADHPFNISSEDDLGGNASVPTILGAFKADPMTYYSAQFFGQVRFMVKQLNGGGTINVTNQAQIFSLDLTAGSSTVNLPDATTVRGLPLVFIKTDSSGHTATLTPTGGQTIGGASTLVLGAQNSGGMIWSDGINWQYGTVQFAVTNGDFEVTGKLGVGVSPVYKCEIGGAPVGGALFAIAGASCAFSDIVLYVVGPAITGDFQNLFFFGGNVTGVQNGKFTNTNSATGSMLVDITVATGSTGDAMLGWTTEGAQAWIAGIDNSDSNAWILAAGSTFDSNFNVLRGDPSTFGVKLVQGKLGMDSTDSSGTPGAATINKASGRSAIASGASSVVITDSKCTSAAQKVGLHIVGAPDGTAPLISAVATSGHFTVTCYNTAGAATNCGANIIFDWWLFD